MKVGSLELDLLLNRTDFDRTIREAERDAQRFRSMDVSVKPTFDMGGLKQVRTEVQTEVSYLNRWLKLNPITPQVDLSQLQKIHSLMGMSGKTIRVEAEIKHKGGSVKSNCCDDLTRSIASNTAPIKDLLKEIAGNTKKDGLIKSGLKSVLSNSIGATIKGGFFELGGQFSQEVTKQVRQGQGGKQASQATARVAARVGNVGINASANIAELAFGASKKKGNSTETMVNDVINFIENIVDPALLDQKATAVRKKFFELYTKYEAGMLSPVELAAQVASSVHAVAPRQINNAVYRTAQVASTPLKVNKEFQNAKVARLVEDFASDLSKARRVLAKNPESKKIKEAENVVIAIGGHERKKGDASQQTSEMLRPFFDEKTAFLEVKNTYTDRYKDDPQSGLFETLKDILEPLGVQMTGEIKSNLSNLEIEMQSAMSGMNPDAIKAAIIKESVKALFPDKNVSFVGFSGGGYPAEQAASISEATGDRETKGFAVATPFFGLTDTASNENFTASIGYLDPLTALFDKDFIGYPTEIIEQLKKMMETKGFPSEAIEMALVQPASNQELFGGNIKHDFQSYLANDENYDLMQSQIPGMLPRQQAFNTEDISEELAQKYPDLIEELSQVEDFLFGVGNIRKVVAKMGRSLRFLDPKDMPEGLDSISKILDKPQVERTEKENNIVDKYIGDVTEQFLKNLQGFEEQLGGLLNAEAISLANKVAQKQGIKPVKPHELDFQISDLAKETDPAKIEQLQQQIDSDKANLSKLKPIQDAMIELVNNWFDNSGFKQNLEAKKKAANEVLDRAAVEKIESYNLDTEQLEPVQKAALGSYLSKREKDDAAFLKGIDTYRNKGNSDVEAYKSFFDYDDPKGKIDFEMQGFRDYVSKPNAKALEGTEFGDLTKSYDRLLENIQAALARFVATGEEIPEEFLNAAEEILKSQDKLSAIDFPDLISQKQLKSPSRYFKGLAEGAKNLTGDKQELSKYEIEQLEKFNKKASKQNKKNPDTNIPLVDIDDVVKLGTGWNGTAVLEQKTGRVIKFAAGDADPLTNAANTIEKEFPAAKPVVDAMRGFIPQSRIEKTLPREAENVDLAAREGLSSVPPHEQVKGFVVMQLEAGKALAEGAQALTGKDPDAIIRFIQGMIDAGELISKFHSAGYKHGDLHLNNVIQKDDGTVAPIDFGTMEELPEDKREKGKAIASDVNKAVNNSRWLLEDKGISINPSLLRTAYTTGVRGTDKSAEDIYNQYQDELLNSPRLRPSSQPERRQEKVENEYELVNPFDIPKQLEIPFIEEPTVNNPLVSLHQVTNDRLDTIVNLLMGNQIGEPLAQTPVDLSEPIKDLVPADNLPSSTSKSEEITAKALAKTEELGRSAIASFGKGIFRGLDNFYQLAKETEKRILDLDPSGAAKFSKKALQLTAVPTMATMAASGLPGIEQAIGVIHGLVDLGFHDLAQGLSTSLMEAVSRTMPDFFAPMMDKLSAIGFADIGESVTQLREVPQHLMDAITDYTLGNVGRTASDIAMGSGAMKVAGDAYNNLQDRTAPEILAEQNSAKIADIAQRLNTPLPGDAPKPDSPEIDAEVASLKIEQLGQAADISAALLNEMFTRKGLVKLAPIAGIKSNTDIDGKPLNKAGVKDVAKYLADNLSEVELAKAISQMPKDRSLYQKKYKDSGIEKPVLSETGYKEFIELMFSAKAEIENMDLATNADEAIAKLERYKAEAKAIVAIFELPGGMAQGRGAAVADLNQTKLAVEAYQKFGDINDLIAKMNSELGKGAIQADRHWGKTTADIFKNFADLAAEAKDKGYDIQKALSKGSPGLLTNIEGHWDKAKVKLKSTFDDIAEDAEESGSKIKLAIKEDLQGLNYTELGEYIGEAISKGINIEADLSNIKDTLDEDRLMMGLNTSLKDFSEAQKIASSLVKQKGLLGIEVNTNTVLPDRVDSIPVFPDYINDKNLNQRETVSNGNLEDWFLSHRSSNNLDVLENIINNGLVPRDLYDPLSKDKRQEYLETGNTNRLPRQLKEQIYFGTDTTNYAALRHNNPDFQSTNSGNNFYGDFDYRIKPSSVAEATTWTPFDSLGQFQTLLRKQDKGEDWQKYQSEILSQIRPLNKVVPNPEAVADIERFNGYIEAQIHRRIKPSEIESISLGNLKESDNFSESSLENILNSAREHEIKIYANLEDLNLENPQKIKALLVSTQKPIKELESQIGIGASKAGKHWGNTTEDILKQFKILAAEAKDKGYDIQRFISEGSPGPTEKIRKHWLHTTKYLLDRINKIQESAKVSGSSIQKAFEAKPELEHRLERMQRKLLEMKSLLNSTDALGAIANGGNELEGPLQQFLASKHTGIEQIESGNLPDVESVTDNSAILRFQENINKAESDRLARAKQLQAIHRATASHYANVTKETDKAAKAEKERLERVKQVQAIHRATASHYAAAGGKPDEQLTFWEKLISKAKEYQSILFGQGEQTNIENDPLRVLDNAYQAYVTTIDNAPNSVDIFNGIKKFTDDMREKSPIFGKILDFGKNVGISAAAILSFDYLADNISRIGKELLLAGRDLQRFEIQMEAIGKSGEAMSSQIFDRSQELGTNYLTSRQGYQRFSQATQGIGNESIIDPIFEGFQKAFVAKQTTAEQQARGYTAIEQIFSKGGLDGSVQSEELKGQLSEALPGAYQTAAKVRGQSPRELAEDMKAAQVEAADLLIRMAAFYEVDSEILLRINSGSFDAELNRLTNNLQLFKEEMGEDLLPFGKAGLQAANVGLNLLSENFALVSNVSGVLILKFLASLTKSMLEVAKTTKLGTVALKAFGIEAALSSIKNKGLYAGGIKPSAKGLLGIGKSIAPIAIASIAAQKVYGEFTAGSEDVKESTKIVSEIARSKSDKPGGDDNLFKRARRKTNELLNPLNFDIESRSSDIKDIKKGLKDIQTINQDVFENLNSEETVKVKDELAKIESQISNLQGVKINLLRSGDSGKLDEVDKKLAKIQVKKKELFKELSGDLATSQKTEKSLETYLSKLEQLKPFISEAAYSKGKDRIQELARAVGINIKTIERNMEATASRADFIIRDIEDSISNANFSLDIKLKEDNIANINKRIGGVLSDRTLEIAKTVDLLANLEGKASNLKENKSSLRGSILREKNLSGAKAALGVTSNDQLFSKLKETSTDTIQGLIENAKESPELVKVLNLLATYIDVSAQETDSREQIINTRLELIRQNREYSRSLYEFGSTLRDFARSLEDLAIEKKRFEVDFPLQVEDAARNITRSSRDLAEQYDDFILGLDRQILQTELELAQIAKQIKNTQLRNDINSSQIGQQGFGRDLAELYLQYAENVQSDEEIELQLNLDRLSVEETVLQNTRQIRNITEQRRSLERDRLEQQRQLTRQQEDFYRQQKRQQEDILDQWYNINLQAQGLGVAVNLTNQGVAQQGQGLVAQIQFLSESIRAKSEELRQAPVILPAVDVLPVPTADIPTSNWHGPLPPAPPTVYGPPEPNTISAPKIPDLQEFTPPTVIQPPSTTATVSLPGVDNINTEGEAEEKTKSVEDLTLEKLDRQRTLTKEQEAEKLINFLNGFELKQLEIDEFFRSQERQTEATAYESEKQSANAKGYLTDDEEIDFAGRDVEKQYGDRTNDLQDRIRALQKQFDSASATITKFSDPKYAGDEQIQKVLESAQNTRTRAADEIAKLGKEQIVIDLEIDTAVDFAETNKAIELEFQRRADELGMRREVAEGRKGLAPSLIHDDLQNKELREIGKEEIDLDYDKQLKELEKIKWENGKISDQYTVMKKALDDLNAVKLEKLYMETNGLVALFDEVAQPALNGLLDDFIDTSVRASDAWRNFARSIIDSLADILMAYAKNEALRMIFGGAGQKGVDIKGKTEQSSGLDWGAALGLGANILKSDVRNQKSDSETANSAGFDIGSAAGIAAGFIPLIFSDGGDTEAMYIPNYREGADTRSLALAKGMQEAMARENHPDAFPAVLHKGEVVLTDLNGDAQLVREKRRTGEWEEMKRTTYQPLKVENYRNGSEGMAAMGRSGATIVNNYTSSVNVKATDASSFKATETQIARRQRLQMERSKR